MNLLTFVEELAPVFENPAFVQPVPRGRNADCILLSRALRNHLPFVNDRNLVVYEVNVQIEPACRLNNRRNHSVVNSIANAGLDAVSDLVLSWEILLGRGPAL